MSGQVVISALYILSGIALGSISLFLLWVWRRDELEAQAVRVGIAAAVIMPVTITPLCSNLATHIAAPWYAQGVLMAGLTSLAIPAYLLPRSRMRRGR